MGILLVCFSLHAPAQESVYRWVDENGNVHYADQPRNANATLFNPRQLNKAKPLASVEEVQANNNQLASINDNTSDNQANIADTLASEPSEPNAEVNDIPSDTCSYLKDQMEQAKLELNSNNPSRVRQARIYLDTADKMLKQSRCN